MHGSITSTILLSILLVGCSKREKSETDAPPNVGDALEQVAAQQSVGFTNGTCTIRKAYHYTGTLPFPQQGSNSFLGLVVEVSGYGKHFDFDDIDLIDAESNENLGSDPGLWLVKKDGSADTGSTEWPPSPGPVTVFLLYERDKLPRRIKLGYWGSEIVKEPKDVSINGEDMFKQN